MTGTEIIPGTPEWLEERRKYICASDAPKILGFSRWGTGLDVCIDKWGEKKAEPPTLVQRRGLVLQDAVAEAYRLRTGCEVGAEAFLVHPKYDWMAATPDGQIIDGPPGGFDGKKHVQIKTHTTWLADEYGPDGSQEIPEAELVQVLHELEVTGNESADLAVLFAVDQTFAAFTKLVEAKQLSNEALGQYICDELDFRIYPVFSNPEIQKDIVEIEREFREKYILPHELPADAPTRKDSGDIRVATEEEIRLIEETKVRWLASYRTEQELEDVKAKVKLAIGEDSGIDAGNGEKITFKKAKSSVAVKTNWENVAKEIAVPPEIADQHSERVVDWEKAVKASPTLKGISEEAWKAILDRHTETLVIKQGTRRFHVPDRKWKKEI